MQKSMAAEGAGGRGPCTEKTFKKTKHLHLTFVSSIMSDICFFTPRSL